MTDFRQGQRVRAYASCGTPEFIGVIESVVIPKDGRRFCVIRADDGHCYHRWFGEIEAIKASRNEGERADHDLLSDR